MGNLVRAWGSPSPFDGEAASAAAATLDLPLPLTMRGCFVYAVKAHA